MSKETVPTVPIIPMLVELLRFLLVSAWFGEVFRLDLNSKPSQELSQKPSNLRKPWGWAIESE